MGSQEISFDRYNSLQKEVGKHNDIQSALKEAYELIKGVVIEKEKNKKNPEKFKELEALQNKFIKEYTDLENSIRDSVAGDKNISIEERKIIMFELSHIVSLAEKNGIKESKGLWSKIGDITRTNGSGDRNMKVDTNTAKEEAMKINEKKELLNKYFKKEEFKKEELSENELKKLLTISNEERKIKGENKAGNIAGYAARWLSLDSTDAAKFSSQEEVIRTNQFQDDIIKRIGLEKGYNGNGDIHAYHPSMGNYITNVPNVESALKTNNVQNLGNKALNNYIGFLESKGELTTKNLKTKFGEVKTQEIFDFIKRNTDKDGKKIFDDSFVNKIINLFDKALKALEEKINGLFNKLNSSKNIEDFKNNLQEIKNYDKDEKTELIKKFDKEIKNKDFALKKLFFEPVKAKLIKNGKSEAEANKEAEKITNEILNEIEANLKVNTLDKVFNIIDKFNIEYPDAKLSRTSTVSLAAEKTELKGKRDAVESTRLADEARRNGNPEGARKHEQDARSSITKASEAKTVGKIVSKISEQESIDIGNGKLDYKKHLQKILSEDENLRKEIENLDAEKKKLEEEVIGTDDTINKTENTSNQVIDAGDAQYNPENGNVQIGEKTLNLSTEEQKLVENNPDTLKNIVDFYSTLNRVGLAKLWPIKEQIFNVISSIKGVGFKIDQNYLSENETKIFLNAILKSTGEETVNPILGINDFIAKIERKNNTQFSGAEAQVNKSGDTKIEQKFISSFAPRGNLLGFNSPAFEQKIRS